MQIPKIIALTGFKGVGKDTFADYLVAKYGYIKTSFAGPLKQTVAFWILRPETIPDDVPPMIVDVLIRVTKEFRLRRSRGSGLNSAVYDFVVEKPYSEDLRRLIQFVGTEYYRAKDHAHWLKSFSVDPNSGIRCVVTDMRFPNELALMNVYGAATARIWRPDYGGDDSHESERHIPLLAVHTSVENVDGELNYVGYRCESMLKDFRRLNEFGTNIVMEEFNG